MDYTIFLPRYRTKSRMLHVFGTQLDIQQAVTYRIRDEFIMDHTFCLESPIVLIAEGVFFDRKILEEKDRIIRLEIMV